jgi:hypothetical protein
MVLRSVSPSVLIQDGQLGQDGQDGQDGKLGSTFFKVVANLHANLHVILPADLHAEYLSSQLYRRLNAE